jgi:hypothetical protein
MQAPFGNSSLCPLLIGRAHHLNALQRLLATTMLLLTPTLNARYWRSMPGASSLNALLRQNCIGFDILATQLAVRIWFAAPIAVTRSGIGM